MKQITFGITFLLVAILLNGQQTQRDANTTQAKGPIVRTISVMVQGTTEANVDIFTGIPYAAPPVGEFRLYRQS